jgi:hypothetical protein
MWQVSVMCVHGCYHKLTILCTCMHGCQQGGRASGDMEEGDVASARHLSVIRGACAWHRSGMASMRHLRGTYAASEWHLSGIYEASAWPIYEASERQL